MRTQPCLSQYKMSFDVGAGFELVYMDDYIDELLHEERCCDVILPRIQVPLGVSNSNLNCN